jgi:Flp pilus assembly pilin Flp
MKYFVIPVIIGATGTVSKGIKNIWKKYQESIQ